MISLAGFGRPSLLAALAFAVIALIACAWGSSRRDPTIAAAGRRALGVCAAFVALAAISLVTALYAHDFSLGYVASYSSRSLSRPYTLSALWGGMEGSLLFWTLLLTVFSAIAIRKARMRNGIVVDRAASILAGIAVFFIALLVFPANPFTVLTDIPADGTGLNPLLQSPGMMIHPPLLYTGFVAFSIPFAFAMSALVERRLDEDWFTYTRRWTLFAWSALSIGIVLGGAWAYTELGWGGYWAWDPVENASFLPWLTATAYLHSVVIQEKRRMFKAWNVSLILLTYLLAVFGTFLTRSGILSSIHTFTEGPIGKWFLPFLAAMLVGGLTLIALRADSLRSENRFDSLLSRESAFLANNVLFLAAAFAVLWGTVYPIVAEVVSGVRLSVGPPFFNSVFIPIGLAILALTGIGPLIAWRRMDPRALARMIAGPLTVAGVLTIGLGISGVRSLGALIAFGACAFTLLAVAGEFVRGSRIYRRREGASWGRALRRTIARNRRRYGGYIVHLGVVLIVVGFAGSAFRVERNAHLSKGESMKVGSYELTYESLQTGSTPEKDIAQATLRVHKGNSDLGTLAPQRNLHTAQGQFQSEVAIRTTPIEDLYVVVTAFDPDGDASIHAFVNPLTWWIWAGAVVMAIGMSVLLTGPIAQPAVATSRVPHPTEPVVVGS
jgi:cytochrome c-type biogenesis protein CcmF